MNARKKLLLLWVVVIVVAALFVSQFSQHVLFVLENCLALALPGHMYWN